MARTIEEIQEIYDLELDKILDEIKAKKPKSVLLQFPDGMKPYAIVIVEYLEKQSPKTQFKIWLGSCFGACDIPQTKSDLIIQFGHAPWR